MRQWIPLVVLALVAAAAGAELCRRAPAGPFHARGWLAFLTAAVLGAALIALLSGDRLLQVIAAGSLPMTLAATVLWRRSVPPGPEEPWHPGVVVAGTALALGLGAALFALPEELRRTSVPLFHDPRPVAFAVLCCVAMAAAVAEEVVFRGALLDMARERVGSTGAVLLTSVLFALAHTGTLDTPAIKEAQMFLFGVASCVVRARSGLRGAMWMHALHNGAVLAVHGAAMG